MATPEPDAPLGKRLAHLRPVAHALADPWFGIALRPIDNAWSHAGITGAMGGFNPARHAYYGATGSVFALWIADPEGYDCPPDREMELAVDVLRFAHDYFHSWCYRVLVSLTDEAMPETPGDAEALERQAYFLVLTEAAAVVATDYWYLSRAGLRQRCGTRFDLGPMTIHYRERLLDSYRRAQPGLTVRCPDFLARIARLYATGEFAGFSESDLLENRALADWMVRELLISPRQRQVARSWLAHLGGLPLDAETAEARFDRLHALYAPLLPELAERVWRKVRHGRQDFVPAVDAQGQWQVAHDGPLDCRFANLSHLDGRQIDWSGGGVSCWSAYVDQVLSRRVMPADVPVAETGARVSRIRETIDQTALTAFVAGLTPVPGEDPAPLELLFVN